MAATLRIADWRWQGLAPPPPSVLFTETLEPSFCSPDSKTESLKGPHSPSARGWRREERRLRLSGARGGAPGQFPGQPSAPLSSPPLASRRSALSGFRAPARAYARRKRPWETSYLSAPGAFPQCRCTAPGPAGSPSPRRRRRLGARPAGPSLSSSLRPRCSFASVPRLFSSALSRPLARASQSSASRGRQGPKVRKQ